MDTQRMTHGVRLANWAGIVRARRDSGLSVRCYCQTYYYWQRRLGQAACERFLSEDLPSQKESPVFAALTMPSSRDICGIVIRLNGAEIEIRGEAKLSTVETVLKVLREC